MHDPTAPHAGLHAGFPSARDAEYWLRRAQHLPPKDAEQVLMEALQRDAQPLTAIARALHDLRKDIEQSPAPPTRFTNATPLRCLPPPPQQQPSPRSGVLLTGRALRVPAHLANTPGITAGASGGAAGSEAKLGGGTIAAVPLPTNFKGILKKLQFSVGEPSASASGMTTATATTHTRGVEAPQQPPLLPATTTKRLQFSTATTTTAAHVDNSPVTASMTTPSLPRFGSTIPRRVTFGTDTVSPAHRGQPPSLNARRSSLQRGGGGAPLYQTPAPIAEDDGGEDAASLSNGTVNSRNAGATPFDERRAMCQGSASPGHDEDGDDDDSTNHVDDDGALFTKYANKSADNSNVEGENQARKEGDKTPDLWKRLAAASPADAIKTLCSDHENDESTKERSVDGCTSDAAPAHQTERSPNNADMASVLGAMLRAALDDIEASKAAEASAQPRQLTPGVRTPTSGALSMSPAVAVGMTPRGGGFDHDQPEEHHRRRLSSSTTPFHFPSTATATATPPPSRDMRMRMSVDGVPRDDSGVPLRTPDTVTVFRGGSASPHRRPQDDPRGYDGLHADLSRSFNTPNSSQSNSSVTTISTGTNAEEFMFRPLPSVPRGSITTSTATATPRPPPFNSNFPFTTAKSESSDGTPDLYAKPAASAKSGRHSLLQLGRPASPSPWRSPSRSPMLGKAQRVPTTPEDGGMASTAMNTTTATTVTPPSSLTREVRGLLEGMRLGHGGTPTPAPLPQHPAVQQSSSTAVVTCSPRRSPRLSRRSSTTAANDENASSINTPTSGAASSSRYHLRSANKASAQQQRTAAGPAATTKKVTPPKSDKALKLSPTEQNIRSSLRRSSIARRNAPE